MIRTITTAAALATLVSALPAPPVGARDPFAILGGAAVGGVIGGALGRGRGAISGAVIGGTTAAVISRRATWLCARPSAPGPPWARRSRA